jgi:NAD-dependent SIR2 family protein deacetylase
MKPINKIYGQNAELLNVKAGGTYNYLLVLKGQQYSFSCLHCVVPGGTEKIHKKPAKTSSLQTEL